MGHVVSGSSFSYLDRESAVLGGMKGLRGEKKNNVLRASSLEFALSTKCGHVEMWICGPG